MKPVVLFCLSRQRIGMNFSATLPVHFVSSRFVEILCELGCTPVGVPIGVDPKGLQSLLTLADGVLLVSGQDICPAHYAEDLRVNYTGAVSGAGIPYQRPLALKPDSQRDELELVLYRHARHARLPVLGICRGMQLINVAEGGSLHQELPASDLEHQIGTDGWVHHHPLAIEEDSLLSSLVANSSLTISTVHHQGIKQLAPSLRATAHTRDGLVEAVELLSSDHFLLGLQGHIEQSVLHFPELGRIWSAFADAVIQRSQHHAQ